MLNKSIFNNVCKKLGFYPNIDCFANRLNHQVSSYISYRPDPTAKFVDSFSINWSLFKFPYLFPPFSLIGNVLQKVKTDRIVAPTQIWYPTLLSMMVSEPIKMMPCQKNLILPDSPEEVHPIWT